MIGALQRLRDWEARLRRSYAAALAFQWGAVDCWTRTGAAVAAVVGADPMEDWRGQYRGPRSALRLLQAQYGTAAAFWTHYLGPPVPWQACRRGDVVRLAMAADAPWPELSGFGVVDLSGRTARHMTRDGMVAVPVSGETVACGWQVGR